MIGNDDRNLLKYNENKQPQELYSYGISQIKDSNVDPINIYVNLEKKMTKNRILGAHIYGLMSSHLSYLHRLLFCVNIIDFETPLHM